MRKIISADYLVKHNYKGYVILKLKGIGKYNYFYAIYHNKILTSYTSTLTKAKALIDGWNNDDQDN